MIDKIHVAKTDYKLLGNYIQLVDERNTALEDLPLMGLSVSKVFFPTIANLVGTDMKTYKIVYKNQFTYIADTSRRGDKIAIALNNIFDKMLVSQAYTPFEVKDSNELLPEYLMMWFRRPEFDRYARFMSHGSAREIFAWEDMCNVLLPVPSIETQRKIVAEYKTVEDRISLNNKLIQKLEETAQAIYREWFVEFEFPFNSPPLEGCPQDGVVNMPDQPGMPNQDGVVKMPDHTGIPNQDGVVNIPDQPGMPNQNTMVNSPDQPEQQDTPKLKRNSINYFSLPYNPALRQRARELRKAGNLAEVLFWKQVRNKSFKGLDFDRQKIIGNYIVDFYCPNCQVVVEIDGASHNDKQEYDAKRDEFLQCIGLTVFHFTDYEVKENIDAVMSFLDKHPALNMERLSDSQEKDVVDKACQQVTQGVSAGNFDQQLTQSVSAGNFDHPVLRTPLQRRGSSQVGYKSSGGKMVWNEELGKEVPEGWEKCSLKDISTCLDYKRKPLSEEERKDFKGEFPYYGAMGIVDYVKEYIFDGEYLLFSEDGVNVIDKKGHPSVFLIWGKFWVNNHAHILVGKDGFSTKLIYSILKEVNVSDLVTGAAQPKINQENMNSIMFLKPTVEIAQTFDKVIIPMFEIIMNKTRENQKLTELKELLLSKLATIEL